MEGLDGVPGVEKHLPTVLECCFHQSETAETGTDGRSARSFSDKLISYLCFLKLDSGDKLNPQTKQKRRPRPRVCSPSDC